jgi:hypothetical protein
MENKLYMICFEDKTNKTSIYKTKDSPLLIIQLKYIVYDPKNKLFYL